MKELTQTNLEPGNCWQTCVACILDLDPERLPPQSEYERRIQEPDGSWRFEGPSYGNALQAYLYRHHGLTWTQLHTPWEQMSIVLRPVGYYMLTGRTVRTESNGARHMVVALGNDVVWDPHPSRAGLTDRLEAHFLIPVPPSWKESRERMTCVCPACAPRPSA